MVSKNKRRFTSQGRVVNCNNTNDRWAIDRVMDLISRSKFCHRSWINYHNMKNIMISFRFVFQGFDCIYEMIGRPGIERMNERGRPICHEFVSVSSSIDYRLA